MRKLKSGLAAVIKDDEDLISETKKIYYSNSTIYSDEKEKKANQMHFEFSKFLEDKDHDILKSHIGQKDA